MSHAQIDEPQRSDFSLPLLVILLSSLVRIFLALLLGRGLPIAGLELAFNLLFSWAWVKRKDWARTGLIFVAICNLIYFFGRLFFQLELLTGLYECVTSLCILLLLVGKPSTVRAYTGVVVYAAVAVLFGSVVAVALMGQRAPVSPLAQHAQPIEQYESPHGYQVAMGQTPWMVLPRDASAKLLGGQANDVDLHVARSDGRAFGLLFPLKFKTLPFSRTLAGELQSEIQQKWLSDLQNWQQYGSEDGFILTAEGQIDQTPLSYVIFYKHFGNLGVYAVFWANIVDSKQLLKDVKELYGHVWAPPLKERLNVLGPTEVYQANADAVVLIHVYDENRKLVGRGSGFNIAPDGLILTNLHVMAQGDYLEILFPRGETYRDVAIVGLSGEDVDLAALSVAGGKLPYIQAFKSVEVSPGDKVYVIGNPKGLVNSLSEGIVGGIREEQDMILYQITAPISSGSSGGPVFNQYGEVIGIANSVVKDAQNLNFSISIDELKHLYFLPGPVELHTLMDYLRQTEES